MTRRGWARLLPLLVALALALAVMWPWPLRPMDVPGSPFMEADNHLWMLWRAARSVWGEPGPWMNWPLGHERTLQDLVHLPMAALLMPLDPAFAYGCIAFTDLLLALLAGWLLSRELGASSGAAMVGMAVLGCAPFFGGALCFGLSEAWTLGCYGLFGALFLRTARTGSLGSALGSGAALAGFALSGWYSAVFAALAMPVWTLWVLVRNRPTAGRWLLLGLVISLALLAVFPALVGFLSSGDLEGLVARRAAPWTYQPGWRHAPQGGTDILNLLLPTTEQVDMARTSYLGLVALSLGLLGLARNRDARVAMSGVLLMAILAMGRNLVFAGHAVGPGAEPLPAPVHWLTLLFPALNGIYWWYRAAGLAVVFLAPAAAMGVGVLEGALGRSFFRMALPLVALVAADDLLLSDAPWPRPVYDPRPPEQLVDVPGDGPLVLLPFDVGPRLWPRHVPRAYQRWQPWLDRPISESYESPDALADNALLAWADRECRAGRMARGQAHQALPPDSARLRDAIDALLGAGVEVVAVVRPRAVAPGRCVAYLEEQLGPAGGDGQIVSWWLLSGTSGS